MVETPAHSQRSSFAPVRSHKLLAIVAVGFEESRMAHTHPGGLAQAS